MQGSSCCCCASDHGVFGLLLPGSKQVFLTCCRCWKTSEIHPETCSGRFPCVVPSHRLHLNCLMIVCIPVSYYLMLPSLVSDQQASMYQHRNNSSTATMRGFTIKESMYRLGIRPESHDFEEARVDILAFWARSLVFERSIVLEFASDEELAEAAVQYLHDKIEPPAWVRRLHKPFQWPMDRLAIQACVEDIMCMQQHNKISRLHRSLPCKGCRNHAPPPGRQRNRRKSMSMSQTHGPTCLMESLMLSRRLS